MPAVNNTEVGVKIYTYIRKQEDAFAQKYPLVNMKETDIAGKVTGMLLRQPEANRKRLNENMTYMVRRIIKAFEVLEDFYAIEVSGVKIPSPEVASPTAAATPAAAKAGERNCRCYVELDAPGITSGQLREALIEVHKVLDPAWMVNGKKPEFIAPIITNLKPSDYKELQARCALIAPLTISLRETLITDVDNGEGFALHALFFSPEFEQTLKANFLRNIAKVELGTDLALPYDPYYPILREFKCHAYWTVAVVKKRFKLALEKTKMLLDTKYKSLFMVSKVCVFDDGSGNKRRIKLAGANATGGMSLSALTQSAWRYKNHEFKTYAETIKKNVEEFGGTNTQRVEGINWHQNEQPAGSSSGSISGYGAKDVNKRRGKVGHSSVGAGRGGRVR